LPQAGNLSLNGQAVAEGQSISTADISAGLLVFAPVANANFTLQAAALTAHCNGQCHQNRERQHGQFQ